MGVTARSLLLSVLALGVLSSFSHSQNHIDACTRSDPGSTVLNPKDLRSQNGVLEVSLAFRNSPDFSGNMRYCYVADDGTVSPTLRVSPGDWLILKLRNEVTLPQAPSPQHAHGETATTPCGGGAMREGATNLHFHGLSVPPICHQDETIQTLIQPSTAAFEYRVRIPENAAPGLYWYHPHPHLFSEAQVLGGASGALIVEGIERANRLIAGLPERVFVFRDQMMPPPKPGAALDPGRPGKDLSVNFVPVPYPEYREAVIEMKPSERQFWRVLNASADTYLDLRLLFHGAAQFMGLIALDGVPIGLEDGRPRDKVLWQSHIALPPAGRAEFVVNGPPAGVEARLLTHAITTGTVSGPPAPVTPTPQPANPVPESALDDDNTPPRPIAKIFTSPTAPEPESRLPDSPTPLAASDLAPLANVHPVRQRKLYFSEKLVDPKDPNSPTLFFITEEGKAPAVFDPADGPNIVVHQGDVEDWLIENRSTETHAFHTHQIHFMVAERLGVPVDELYLRDTVNVPFWDGFTPQYPSVKLRMDFRDPNIVGTFPYHCHVLQHEDGGMMGTIRVEPAATAKTAGSPSGALKLNHSGPK
jgi:FtsP/CotA-like multicopper oxidase with cupredoxin domain